MPDRKEFIKKFILGVASLPLIVTELGCERAKSNPDNPDNVYPSEPPLSNNCNDITKSATEGPFYVENIPETVNINNQNLPGINMRISGTVYGKDKKPLETAKVEIWHADSQGAYHPAGNGDVSRYPVSEVTLRGTAFTNDKGLFAFNSIKPGLYTGRRRHIHWRISEENNGDIITQTYWLSEKGDAREKIDGTDRNTDICRYIDFENEDNGITGKIDFHLG